MFEPGDRVYMYVIADSETELSEDDDFAIPHYGPGTVLHIIQEDIEYPELGDFQNGDIIILSDDPEDQVLKPYGRAYSKDDTLGPYGYIENAYGGYWAHVIIIPGYQG